MRAQAMLLSLCIVSVNIPGCGLSDAVPQSKGKSASRPGGLEPDPDDARTYQKDLDELLAKKKAEAREWLAKPKSLISERDRTLISDAVNKMYAAGAVKIYAVDILETDEGEASSEFAVELPPDKAARSGVIDAHNAFWKRYSRRDVEEGGRGRDVTDQGQKYLILSFE